MRGEHQTARELGEQVLHLAQSARDPALLLEAHYALGVPLLSLGEFALPESTLSRALPSTTLSSTGPMPSSMHKTPE